MYEKFQGGKLTIYTSAVESFSIPVNKTELKAMLGVIGFHINEDGSYGAFDEKAIEEHVLTGKINPFNCIDVNGKAPEGEKL